jgi:hypothetical protein
MDAEGVATFNAATHTIVGNATVEGSLLAMAETTDEFILTFNAGTETWEPEANAASAAEHAHVAAEITDLSIEDNADVTVGTPSDEQVFTWNDGAEYWEAQTAAASGGSGSAASHFLMMGA